MNGKTETVMRVLLVVLVVIGSVSGGPLLYLTMHGGKEGAVNLHAYDMNGNSQFLLPTDDAAAELRGMAQRDGQLFVAQAHTSDSSILRFPLCAKASAQHVFTGGSLSHPYGLGIWQDMLFVSNQDTDAVSTFNLTQNREVSNGFPEIDGPRGLATDAKGRVYVASKGADAVIVFDRSGNQIGTVPKEDPIGVAVFQDLLVVTGGKSGSSVDAFNCTTLGFASVWSSSRTLAHGAGVALDAASGTLFVVEQDTSSVLKFDVRTGNYQGVFVANLEDSPEQIFFTAC